MAERRCADRLARRERAGQIEDLRSQVRVEILGLFSMRVDFAYVEDGLRILHEFKGFADRRSGVQLRAIEHLGWLVCDEYRLERPGRPLLKVRCRPSEAILEGVRRWQDGEGQS